MPEHREWEDDESHWRKTHGEEIRRLKDHEADEDPDWSLPEIDREKPTLAKEFFDWLYARGGATNRKELGHMFDAWCELKWRTPLSVAAKGLLLYAVTERMRKHQAEEREAPLPAPDEDILSYVQRASGDAPAAVPESEESTMPPVPEPPKEAPTLPYKDSDDEVKCACPGGCLMTIPESWEERMCPPCVDRTCGHSIPPEPETAQAEPYVATDDDVDWLESPEEV